MRSRSLWLVLLLVGTASAVGLTLGALGGAFRPDPVATPGGLSPVPYPPMPGSLSSLSVLMRPAQPARGGAHPTLEDFWEGRARFVVEVQNTGLPMGESDTIVMRNGELWSYVHASWQSAGVRDRCGDPVQFPGCVVIYRSFDGGYTFHHDRPPVCQFECQSCPCTTERDHIDQQQYPRVFYAGQAMVMAHEYRGRVVLRRSYDGVTWSRPEVIPSSGPYLATEGACAAGQRIGMHPHTAVASDCLAGGPPGIFIDEGWLYVFFGSGQNPGGLGCFFGPVNVAARQLQPCVHNPLLRGAAEYGPLLAREAEANPFFDFRTISSAEVQRIGDRFYLMYEGVRGPGPGDPGDTQFGLGLARSLSDRIDGPWEKYPGNPILVDLPGNIGLGHADLVVLAGQTLLYTSLDGRTRSRLALVWK